MARVNVVSAGRGVIKQLDVTDITDRIADEVVEAQAVEAGEVDGEDDHPPNAVEPTGHADADRRNVVRAAGSGLLDRIDELRLRRAAVRRTVRRPQDLPVGGSRQLHGRTPDVDPK